MSEATQSDRERIEEIASDVADARFVYVVYETPEGDTIQASHVAVGEYETARDAVDSGVENLLMAAAAVERKLEEIGGHFE